MPTVRERVFGSNEQRAARRATRAAKKAVRESRRMEKDTVRAARLALKQAKQERALAKTRRNLSLTQGRLMTIHAEAHSEPSHHVGPCDEACRAGERAHRHRGSE